MLESVISGYSGGNLENPTYEQVRSGTTGHYGVVPITYDPTKLSYETILNIYWQQMIELILMGNSMTEEVNTERDFLPFRGTTHIGRKK